MFPLYYMDSDGSFADSNRLPHTCVLSVAKLLTSIYGFCVTTRKYSIAKSHNIFAKGSTFTSASELPHAHSWSFFQDNLKYMFLWLRKVPILHYKNYEKFIASCSPHEDWSLNCKPRTHPASIASELLVLLLLLISFDHQI